MKLEIIKLEKVGSETKYTVRETNYWFFRTYYVNYLGDPYQLDDLNQVYDYSSSDSKDAITIYNKLLNKYKKIKVTPCVG